MAKIMSIIHRRKLILRISAMLWILLISSFPSFHPKIPKFRIQNGKNPTRRKL